MRLFFSFKGRINRAQWFLGQLIGVVFFMGLVIYAARSLAIGGVFSSNVTGLKANPSSGMFDPLNTWPFLITAGLWCWIYLATTAKRLHDQGYNGLWATVGMLPVATGIWLMNTCPFCTGDAFLLKLAGFISLINYLAGPLMLIICGFMPGDPGTNAYGPPPGNEAAEWNERQVTDGVMPPSGLAKFDDAYFERYRQSMLALQAKAEHEKAAPVAREGDSKPTFGKR
jgi:uncharacterized membrane protein YhaH (DUF805 family)